MAPQSTPPPSYNQSDATPDAIGRRSGPVVSHPRIPVSIKSVTLPPSADSSTPRVDLLPVRVLVTLSAGRCGPQVVLPAEDHPLRRPPLRRDALPAGQSTAASRIPSTSVLVRQSPLGSARDLIAAPGSTHQQPQFLPPDRPAASALDPSAAVPWMNLMTRLAFC